MDPMGNSWATQTCKTLGWTSAAKRPKWCVCDRCVCVCVLRSETVSCASTIVVIYICMYIIYIYNIYIYIIYIYIYVATVFCLALVHGLVKSYMLHLHELNLPWYVAFTMFFSYCATAFPHMLINPAFPVRFALKNMVSNNYFPCGGSLGWLLPAMEILWFVKMGNPFCRLLCRVFKFFRKFGLIFWDELSAEFHVAGHTHYLQCWGDHLGSLDLLPLYQFETAMEVETVKPFSRGFIFMSMFVSKCGNQYHALEFDMRWREHRNHHGHASIIWYVFGL